MLEMFVYASQSAPVGPAGRHRVTSHCSLLNPPHARLRLTRPAAPHATARPVNAIIFAWIIVVALDAGLVAQQSCNEDLDLFWAWMEEVTVHSVDPSNELSGDTQ